MGNPRVILASASRARNEMLRNAGLEFESIPADIDEASVIAQGGEDIAAELAQQKALKIAAQNPDALVIGSDQILECDGQIFEKAKDEAAAIEKLKMLRGKTHRLMSAVAIAKGNDILWQTQSEATLTMHDFDDEFLTGYINGAQSDILSCVGAYAIEKSGAWLFSDIKGDYFTILGMPLLPLLSYLKNEHGLKP